MPEFRIEWAGSFHDLYNYWQKAMSTNTPFTALLLSTEISNLERKITDFIIRNNNELDNMSGKSCAVFATHPPKKFYEPLDSFRSPIIAQEVKQIKDISYSVGRQLNVPPESFPSIVFFDNLMRPQKTVTLSLKSILGDDPNDNEFAEFFRKLFTITHTLSVTPDTQRLSKLQKAIEQKWRVENSNLNISKIVATTASIVEVATNVMTVINNLYGAVGTVMSDRK